MLGYRRRGARHVRIEGKLARCRRIDVALAVAYLAGNPSGGLAVDQEQENRPEYDRLRPAPSVRFAGDSHLFDLGHALASLRAESHPVRSGHRQVTLFHRTPVTHVLFAFDPGGTLPSHATRGVVTIHVLEGHLTVEAEETRYDLRAGQMLILKPDLPHDVHAVVTSAMLLTVHMEDGR
jgi:quercetin dioxygenase-like cupin family protein